MSSSPSPDGDNASSSDDPSDSKNSCKFNGGGCEEAAILGRRGMDDGGEGGRRASGGGGENYETTADIDLQQLEELGMSIQSVISFCGKNLEKLSISNQKSNHTISRVLWELLSIRYDYD
jgi:hypothetical protein